MKSNRYASVVRRLSATLIAVCLCSCATGPWTPPAPPAAMPSGLARPEPVAFMPEDDLWSRASADGRYVAFVSQQNGNMDIWVRDYARRSTYPLTLDAVDDFDPDVAPGGHRVVFVSRRSDAKGDLYLTQNMEAGGEPKRLSTEASHDRQPTFSADGKHVYFTQSFGVGDEFIAELDLQSLDTRRLSPGPGFDPTSSPDGRYLVYTAPAAHQKGHPHLVALRLVDGATRALALPDGPSGFARFYPDSHSRRLVFTRFADDDDRSGALDAGDQASLWRVDVDFHALFEGEEGTARPFPLTDGAEDELFGSVQSGFLFFTQGTEQQDILRLPAGGTFPEYESAQDYFALAETIQDARTRWFVLRCAYAKSEPHSLLEAQALLRIARLQQNRERPDLAHEVYLDLLNSTQGAASVSPRGQLRGLAEVALAEIARSTAMQRASGTRARAAAVLTAFARVAELERRYAGSNPVLARATLQRAEVLVDAGRRVQAAELLHDLVERFPSESETAARAFLRRVDLLGVAYAPEAIGAAYSAVLERFPRAQGVVRMAATRIVELHLGRLETQGDPEREIDALRRLVGRYGPGPVRAVARWGLVMRMRAQDRLRDAAAELSLMVKEAGDDRIQAALALRGLAQVEEQRGRMGLAVAAWQMLRASYADLPGFGAEARASITRVSLVRARAQEQAGDFEAAAAAYHRVIEHDVTQVQAHRRYLALSARIGTLAEAQEEAELRAATSPRTPVARYAHALALTWYDPPKLDLALEEIDQALALNPQLVHAYITRGWIKEMQELFDPGIVNRTVTAVIEGVGRSLGGFLDVEIGKQGLLEGALEDYGTALRLNAEAQAPETEAEVLLNLGNAHYRLGAKTNDVGNMRAAFERYLEVLALGLEHRDPRAELVFWERLGRAAAWVDEPAVGVMATRTALDVAERSGLSRRSSQLVGNLALLYSSVSEDAYARDALGRFESERANASGKSGWVVAVRDRARAQLDTISARDRLQLEGVLDTLAAGRAALLTVQEMDRGTLPTLWLPLGADASRAQYGFDVLSELDVNLSLAEAAHRGLGDVSKAQNLRRLRLALTRRMIDEVPTLFAGVGEEHPTPLGIFRERLGLALSEVHELVRQDRLNEAEAALRALREELDGWLESARYAKDHPALRVDRARLWTVAVEILVRRVRAVPATRKALDADLENAQQDLREAIAGTLTSTLADPSTVLAELPEALTSSLAYTLTASAALARSPFVGVVHEAHVMAARLAYSQGLLALWDAEPAHRGASLLGLWKGLDGQLIAYEQAETLFQEAALKGARGGAGLGLRVSALALAALSRVQWINGRPEGLTKLASKTALRMTEVAGEGRLGWLVRLLAAQVGPESELQATLTALAAALPSEVGPVPGLLRTVFARSASVALSNGDVLGALGALDRNLLFEAAAGPLVDPGVGPDADGVQGLARAYTLSAQARQALAACDGRTPARVFERRLAEAGEGLARARRAARELKLSEVGRLRVRAEAKPSDELEYDLEPREALLLPAPLDGVLHLLLVDGSTSAVHKVVHLVSDVPLAVVQQDLRQWRSAAQRGAQPDSARLTRLRKALLAPLQAHLANKDTLYVASGLLGGTLPVNLTRLDEPVLAHISAPSALGAVRAAQLVGVQGRLAAVASGQVPWLPESTALSAEDLLSFGRARGTTPLDPGQDSPIAERPAVQSLAERAQDLLVVQAPVKLEPRALERSMLQLQGGLVPSRAAGGAELEVALGVLDLPARLLVLGKVIGPPEAWARLDLPLAARGFATTIMIPEGLPEAVVKRFVARIAETSGSLGPARALRAAVQAHLHQHPRLALSTLVGSPGLDSAQTKAFAKSQVLNAKARALTLLKRRAFAAVVPAFERWIRAQIESGITNKVPRTYRGLVGILEHRLVPTDYARTAEVQQAYLEFLKSNAASAKTVADAEIDLGLLLSRAHDYSAAEAHFKAVIEALTTRKDAQGIGRAWYRYGLHRREALQFEASAEAMEKAIQVWEGLGLYRAKKVPKEALRALREVGELYLNSLSDPVRAGRAFLRARKYARRPADRISVTLDLVRVARRRGDFGVAAAEADIAQAEARKAGLEGLGLSALIEAANVAWYQGDYRRGHRLCGASIDTADRLLAAVHKKKSKRAKSSEKQLRRRKIYALSVCGLVSMSQRHRSAALEYLQDALRTARALRDPRETATQYSNLGRVYLEFGEFETAEGEFNQAKVIDERLQDRYSLAYDLRNIGVALLHLDRYEAAHTALTTALAYSQQAKDTNNELRVRFSLGELAHAQTRWPEAVKQWKQALLLAERLDVKSLAWQSYRRLGQRAQAQGQGVEAEALFVQAVAIARSMTGGSAPSAVSPPLHAAFDDLARLYLQSGETHRAFSMVDEARRFEQLELLQDDRIYAGRAGLSALIHSLRTVGTSTGARLIRTQIAELDPRVGALLGTADSQALQERLPKGAAVMTFRVTEGALLSFWLDREGLVVSNRQISKTEISALVADYSERLRSRADLSASSAALSRLLLAPFKSRLSETTRLALVSHGVLRYVPFAALPFEDGALIDQTSVVRALHPEAAVRALVHPAPALGTSEITALSAVPLGEVPLPFAARELTVIKEEYPQAKLLRGRNADRSKLLAALKTGPGVVHFAGHTDLRPSVTVGADPLAGGLQAFDGLVTLLDILQGRTRKDLVVLSACSTRLARPQGIWNGADLLSLAESFHLAGAKAVLATTLRVDDMAAALVVKRFYRAARTQNLAESLRAAQIAVRRAHPHPAWWAGFVLSEGG